MFNNKFLKKLTILYVEDDNLARAQLAKALSRLFKEVIQASNGEEGYTLFNKYHNNNQPIDLILSDINMPKLNGIELLEKIREVDKDIPVMFTTARSETEYLLKAIELNVNYYALKPINLEDIIMRIQNVCEKRYYKEALNNKQKELQNYIHAIDNIAVIYKMNTDGQLTFANNNFLELTGYTKEEISKIKLSDILHPSHKEKYMKETWKELLTDQKWKGNTKYLSKDQKKFYLHITIFKIDESLQEDEFITLGFVTTKESLKQREFHKKVMLNLKENNLKVNQSKKIIQEKSYLVDQLKNYIIELESKLKEEHQKNIKNQKQLKYYEDEMSHVQDNRTTSLQEAHLKLKESTENFQHIKKERDLVLQSKEKLKEQVNNVAIEMKKLYTTIDEKDKHLLELQDLLKFRESQIMMIDPKLLNK